MAEDGGVKLFHDVAFTLIPSDDLELDEIDDVRTGGKAPDCLASH